MYDIVYAPTRSVHFPAVPAQTINHCACASCLGCWETKKRSQPLVKSIITRPF